MKFFVPLSSVTVLINRKHELYQFKHSTAFSKFWLFSENTAKFVLVWKISVFVRPNWPFRHTTSFLRCGQILFIWFIKCCFYPARHNLGFCGFMQRIAPISLPFTTREREPMTESKQDQHLIYYNKASVSRHCTKRTGWLWLTLNEHKMYRNSHRGYMLYFNADG